MNHEHIISVIKGFAGLKIMVIGDVILDAYFKGKVERISPEAPVPVLDIKSKEFRLGGAANVALNAKALGAECTVCSVIGHDQTGKLLLDLMQQEDLTTAGIIINDLRTTSLKTRLVSGFSQLMRMDEEDSSPMESDLSAAFSKLVISLIETNKPDAIIFEDYDKGVIDESLIKQVMTKAKAMGVPVAVDPKRRNFFAYHGANLFKPNLKELREGLNLPSLAPVTSDLNKAFNLLKERMSVQSGLFTLSEHGVFITDGEAGHHVPAVKRSIADVSGAGDTVIAAAACALAKKMTLEELAYVSNLAGGWVCQFPGVVSIPNQQLIAEISKQSGNGY
jgi:rfaE bifunctional protein kinase chain/domain